MSNGKKITSSKLWRKLPMADHFEEKKSLLKPN